MNCYNCKGDRIVEVSAKCSHINIHYKDDEFIGNIPSDIGIGGDEYIEFTYCLDCGMIQEDFPFDDPEELDDDYRNW